MMFPEEPEPLTVSVIGDYDVVAKGVSRMFDGYRHRIRVLEGAPSKPERVDIALYDTFAQPEADLLDLEALVDHPLCRKVVIYTWSFHRGLIGAALRRGADGYVSKALPAAQVVEALEKVGAGHQVVSRPPPRAGRSVGLNWPGRTEGLTEREAEILALIVQGRTNAEIAGLTVLSINSIESHIRSAYRRIGVSNRVEAVLWGTQHGLRPDQRRISVWIDG